MADPRAPRRGGGGARARLAPRSGDRRAARRAAARRPARRTTSRRAVRRTGARVVHAHNVNPSFGWRALAAAREAGRARRAAPAQLPARVRGRDCASRAARTARAATAATRCPGVRLNCRGGSRAEAAVYARRRWRSGSGGWPRRPTRSSCRARSRSRRLRELGAPLGDRARTSSAPSSASSPTRSRAADGRARARRRAAGAREGLRATRSTRARAAGLPLVIAGDGPQARRAARARRRRRRALRRARRRRPSWRALRARRRRSRSCPRASPRSSRSPRSRRWPPGCPWRPPTPAGCARSCPSDGLVPARRRRRARRRGSRALGGDAEAGERGLAVRPRALLARGRRARSCARSTTGAADGRSLPRRPAAHASGRAARPSAPSRPAAVARRRPALHHHGLRARGPGSGRRHGAPIRPAAAARAGRALPRLGPERRFGGAGFWTDDGAGLLFLFHLHGFADLGRYCTEPATAAADAFWANVISSWLDECGRPRRPAWHPFPTQRPRDRLVAALVRGWLGPEPGRRDARSLPRQAHAAPPRGRARHRRQPRAAQRDRAGLRRVCLGDCPHRVHAASTCSSASSRARLLRDGGHEERSPAYHRAVLGDLEDVEALLRRPVARRLPAG